MLVITLFSLLATFAPAVHSHPVDVDLSDIDIDSIDLDDQTPRIDIKALCTPPSGREDVFYDLTSIYDRNATDLPPTMSYGMHYSVKFCTDYMKIYTNYNTTEEENFAFLQTVPVVWSAYNMAETQNVPDWIDMYNKNITEEEEEAFFKRSDGVQWSPYLRHENGTETYAGDENYVACSTVNITSAIDSACDKATSENSGTIESGKNVTVTVTGITADPLKLTIAAVKKSTVKATDCKKEMKALVETYTWNKGFDTPAGNMTAAWSYSQDGNVKTKIEWANRKVMSYWDLNGEGPKDGIWCTKLNEELEEVEGTMIEVAGKSATAAAGSDAKKDGEESAAVSGRQVGWSAFALSVAAAWALF